MSDITAKPSYTPRCPNHGAPLEGLEFPIPAKGTGICPISKCEFDYEAEVDEQKMVKDKDGNLVPSLDWKVSGEEK